MKRLLLITAVLLTVASMAKAQSSNRVLVEEFSSSTCPPCATTDPIMEQFENAAFDSVCVLKWHQRFPSPGNDPAWALYPNGEARLDFYGITGIPGVVLNGNPYFNPGSGLQYLEDSLRDVYGAMKNYYTMSITQQLTADSIIAYITITTAANAPSDPNLRMSVVFAERYYPYHGTNGRYYHESVVRATEPPLSSLSADTGAFSQAAAFTQAPGTTQSYRIGTVLNSKWNRTQMMSVAILQDDGSKGVSKKEVFQSAWTEPINVVPISSQVLVAGNPAMQSQYTIENKTANAEKLILSLSPPKTSTGYTISVTGIASDSTITIPANGSAPLTLTANASGKATASDVYGFSLHTSDSIGVGGHIDLVIGKDIKVAVVDAGADAYTQTYTSPANIMSALSAASIPAVEFVEDGSTDNFSADFDNWSNFSTIFYDAGYFTGLYTNTGDTGRLTNYLANGGHFVMLSAQMADIYESAGLQDYVTNTFHLTPTGSLQQTWNTLNGVTNDPIGNGINNAVVQNALFTEGLVPFDNTATSVFYNENGDTVGVRAEQPNGAKTLYLSFELGNIAPTATLRTVVNNILAWLNGTASVTQTESSSNAALDANYPNPLTSTTSIGYTIPDRRYVTLIVRDMLGREVTTLVSKDQGAGHYSVPFDASHLPAGTYIYTLTAGGNKLEGKMTVNR